MPPSLLRVFGCALLVAGCSSEPSSAVDRAGLREPAKPRLAHGGPETPEPTAGASGSQGQSGGQGQSGSQGQSEGGAPSPSGPVTGGCTSGQFVLRPDLSNARDLGGVPLTAGGEVACGAVYRGPPLRLTDAGCQALESLGLRTVIDLRSDGERLGAPESACVTSKLVAAPLPIPYGLGPEDYLSVLNTEAAVAAVFHTLGDPDAYPVYFHCTYGRDRTGVIGALLLLALGATREAVMEEYLLSAPNVGAYPDALTAVLDDVEQRGGAQQVLLQLGISEEEIAVLRSRAISE